MSSFCVKFWQQGSEGRGERFKQSKESLDEDAECQLLLLSAAAPLSLCSLTLCSVSPFLAGAPGRPMYYLLVEHT